MNIRIAGYQGDGSVHTKGLRTFAAALSEEVPDLQVDLEIDVTAVGIGASNLFSGTEEGERHICYMASGYLSARVPTLNLLDVPFSIIDRARAFAALDGHVGETLRSDVVGATGLDILAYWDNGFRHISNRSHPLRTPADCKDLVIRTLNNETYVGLLEDIGFKPVITDVKELVESVKSGTVDAQENPLTNLVNFKLHKFHRYVSMTSHIFGVALFVVNKNWWASLGDDQRTAIHRATMAATVVQRQASIDDDEELVSFLREDGVEVLSSTDLDLDAFRDVARKRGDALREVLPPELCGAYLQA